MQTHSNYARGTVCRKQVVFSHRMDGRTPHFHRYCHVSIQSHEKCVIVIVQQDKLGRGDECRLLPIIRHGVVACLPSLGWFARFVSKSLKERCPTVRPSCSQCDGNHVVRQLICRAISDPLDNVQRAIGRWIEALLLRRFQPIVVAGRRPYGRSFFVVVLSVQIGHGQWGRGSGTNLYLFDCGLVQSHCHDDHYYDAQVCHHSGIGTNLWSCLYLYAMDGNPGRLYWSLFGHFGTTAKVVVVVVVVTTINHRLTAQQQTSAEARVGRSRFSFSSSGLPTTAVRSSTRTRVCCAVGVLVL